MRLITCVILFFLSIIHYDIAAQEFNSVRENIILEDIKLEDIINYYSNASSEEKAAIDSAFFDTVEKWKTQQVNSICGIPFGSSRLDAAEVLRNKYGEPYSLSSDNHIIYKNLKYAGINFDSIHFLFQSDGLNSYLNACFFIKDTKSKQKAIEILDLYKEVLGEKYQLLENTDESGFKIFGGGISPLWDGSWFDFVTNMVNGKSYMAIHVDVLEYEDEFVREFGNKYGVRIIYGPFEYVKEEF